MRKMPAYEKKKLRQWNYIDMYFLFFFFLFSPHHIKHSTIARKHIFSCHQHISLNRHYYFKTEWAWPARVQQFQINQQQFSFNIVVLSLNDIVDMFSGWEWRKENRNQHQHSSHNFYHQLAKWNCVHFETKNVRLF